MELNIPPNNTFPFRMLLLDLAYIRVSAKDRREQEIAYSAFSIPPIIFLMLEDYL